MEVKTIDVRAKEWRDKVYGNTYFSAQISVNYGMEDEKEFQIPFQYGDGRNGEFAALKLLEEKGVLPMGEFRGLWNVKERGIILRTYTEKNCKKIETEFFGKGE